MIQAEYTDKELVVDILANAFKNNKSVNYIITQDEKKEQRVRRLMEYSFGLCYRYGKVVLTTDKKACALILFPDKKRISLYSICLDMYLVFSCIGLLNVKRAMERESKIKQLQLKNNVYYLWFIGVYPVEQNKGIGSMLLNNIINDAHEQQRIICLETSTVRNIPWYEKFGFQIYDQLNLGYTLFFLKK